MACTTSYTQGGTGGVRTDFQNTWGNVGGLFGIEQSRALHRQNADDEVFLARESGGYLKKQGQTLRSVPVVRCSPPALLAKGGGGVQVAREAKQAVSVRSVDWRAC